MLNFVRFSRAHVSCLSRSLWMVSLPSVVLTAPHSLVSSANLLRVHLIPLSMLPTKMFSSTCHSTDPRGTPFITGLYLDIRPLTATL